MIGLFERVSPKLWKVLLTDLATSNQLQLEISKNQIVIFLFNQNAMPLLDKIENYIRHYIAANFDCLALN